MLRAVPNNPINLLTRRSSGNTITLLAIIMAKSYASLTDATTASMASYPAPLIPIPSLGAPAAQPEGEEPASSALGALESTSCRQGDFAIQWVD